MPQFSDDSILGDARQGHSFLSSLAVKDKQSSFSRLEWCFAYAYGKKNILSLFAYFNSKLPTLGILFLFSSHCSCHDAEMLRNIFK